MRLSDARPAACVKLLALVLLAGTAAADGRTRRYAASDAGGAQPSAASRAPPEAAAAAFLSSSRAAVSGAELVVDGVVRGKRGLTHVRFQQYAGGLRVADAYARATVGPDGAVVHALEGLAPAQAASAAAARAAALAPAAAGGPSGSSGGGGSSGGVGLTAAIRAAQAHLGYAPGQRYFERPSAERVLAERPGDGGALVPAWEVTTWTLETNQLHLTYVDQETGGVLYSRRRTSGADRRARAAREGTSCRARSERHGRGCKLAPCAAAWTAPTRPPRAPARSPRSYKVFLPSPLNGQAPVIANGPAPTKPKGGTPSPLGWLSKKKQYARMITGNNVQARQGGAAAGL
jgi:hypothetical protein